MFCGKCGTRNADEATFCKECGAPLHSGQSASPPSSTIPLQNNQRNKKIGILATAAVVVIAVVVFFALFGGRSEKATIRQFVDATFAADAETLIHLFPDELIDYVLREEGYDREEMIDTVKEPLQEGLESYDEYFGENWDISYEVLRIESVDRDDLDDLKDSYEPMDVDVSAAKTAEVQFTVTGGDTETSSTVELTLMKVGRSWYIDAASMGGLI